MLFETENLKLSPVRLNNAEYPFSKNGFFTQMHTRNNSLGSSNESSNLKDPATIVLSNEKNKNSITKFKPKFS